MFQGGWKMLEENDGDEEMGLGRMAGITLLIASLYRKPWVVFDMQ
jgi:hypothetical protein